MQPHCSAMPWMPGITDFTAIPNMGVVLLSCITASAITRVSVTASFMNIHILPQRRACGVPRTVGQNVEVLLVKGGVADKVTVRLSFWTIRDKANGKWKKNLAFR